jgi:hypothetical protein
MSGTVEYKGQPPYDIGTAQIGNVEAGTGSVEVTLRILVKGSPRLQLSLKRDASKLTQIVLFILIIDHSALRRFLFTISAIDYDRLILAERAPIMWMVRRPPTSQPH